MQAVIVMFVVALLGVPVLPVVAWCRRAIVDALFHFAVFLAMFGAGPARRLGPIANLLAGAANAMLNSMAARKSGATDAEDARPHGLWLIAPPLLYLALSALCGGGDLYLNTLRLQAMLHLPATWSTSAPLDLMVGGLLFTATVIHASIIFDGHGLTRAVSPFTTASARMRAAFLLLAWAGIALAAVACLTLFTWGQLAISGRANDALSMVFVLAFAATLFDAFLLAGWSLMAALGSLWFIMLALLALLCWLLCQVCLLAVHLIDRAVALVVRLYDIPASMGRGVIEYVTRFEWGVRLRIRPPEPFDEVASITDELGIPPLAAARDQRYALPHP